MWTGLKTGLFIFSVIKKKHFLLEKAQICYLYKAKILKCINVFKMLMKNNDSNNTRPHVISSLNKC